MRREASITEAEFRRLAKLARETGTSIRYRRNDDAPLVEIKPY